MGICPVHGIGLSGQIEAELLLITPLKERGRHSPAYGAQRSDCWFHPSPTERTSLAALYLVVIRECFLINL